MLELYIKLVEGGKRTLGSVPEQFREEVRKALGITEKAKA